MREIYFNAKIITMEEVDAEAAMDNAPEAVMVKDGVIERVGALSEIKAVAGKRAKYHDLQGKCLMPAFIDAHSHFIMNAKMSLCVDLSECISFDDIAITLTNYIINNNITEKNCVMGFGYDHNFLKEAAHPDKRVLDQVSKTVPIFILHVSAHLACVNSAALRIAEIDENTADPAGGHIERMENGKEPSGYLEEAAVALVQVKVGSMIKKDMKQMLKSLQKRYLRYGVTTVQDGATTAADFKLLQILSQFHLLKVDVVAYPLMTAGGIDVMHKYGDKYGEYRNRVKIGGYKLVLDGSPQGRTAWMSEPYKESGDYRGYAWLSDEDMERYVRIAVQEGKQLLAHCNGDAASEQFLNVYEKITGDLKETGELRPVMIHCQTVRNDQLDRMSKIGMIASVFIGHVWYWGDIHLKNFGEERGNRISPVHDALERGVTVNFHQDTPVTKPDMLHSVWCAVNRTSRSGKIIGKAQRVSVYDALKAITINAAYEYFEEDIKGTIKEGKKADLVVLSSSPLETAPEEITNIEIIETIKEGKTVYREVTG